MEKERGISVTTSVMQFPYNDCLVNLLDTPGHEDFSEDTYRTLTAVDSCLMVIDAAKGVEDRTRKLMEVTRLRDWRKASGQEWMLPMHVSCQGKLRTRCMWADMAGEGMRVQSR